MMSGCSLAFVDSEAMRVEWNKDRKLTDSHYWAFSADRHAEEAVISA